MPRCGTPERLEPLLGTTSYQPTKPPRRLVLCETDDPPHLTLTLTLTLALCETDDPPWHPRPLTAHVSWVIVYPPTRDSAWHLPPFTLSLAAADGLKST